MTETLYEALLSRPDSLESAVLAARPQMAQDAATLDWASIQLYAGAADGDDSRPILFRPFRGLLAFQPEHRRFFFGRDAVHRQGAKSMRRKNRSNPQDLAPLTFRQVG